MLIHDQIVDDFLHTDTVYLLMEMNRISACSPGIEELFCARDLCCFIRCHMRLFVVGFCLDHDVQFLGAIGFIHHIHKVGTVVARCHGWDADAALRYFAIHYHLVYLGLDVLQFQYGSSTTAATPSTGSVWWVKLFFSVP